MTWYGEFFVGPRFLLDLGFHWTSVFGGNASQAGQPSKTMVQWWFHHTQSVTYSIWFQHIEAMWVYLPHFPYFVHIFRQLFHWVIYIGIHTLYLCWLGFLYVDMLLPYKTQTHIDVKQWIENIRQLVWCQIMFRMVKQLLWVA